MPEIRKNAETVNIIGAGLAGCEAAWQLVRRGVGVRLYEMRPYRMTTAHKTGLFAELVCSNSLRAEGLENAAGLLKEEMRLLDSLIMRAALAARVPAGGALAVDRRSFSLYIADVLLRHPLLEFINREVTDGELFSQPAIIATGPLTSDKFSYVIKTLTGEEHLYFYDAQAPLLDSASLRRADVFLASRYGKGEGSYINCPLDKSQYQVFRRELINAEVVAHGSPEEKTTFFEGCLPIEELARRGEDTMRFGPLKPVGLLDPATLSEPYAVVQLRQDDAAAAVYNMVGFQTRLKWPEQKRVFSLIPGLGEAEFLRYGVMHRNTFINSPRLLTASFALRKSRALFFAGQITGVEGYIESAASGLAAGINAARIACGLPPAAFPPQTALGALAAYISNPAVAKFQPININFGLFPPLEERVRGRRDRKRQISARSLTCLYNFQNFFRDSIV